MIYGEGKTAAQIVSIASALFENGQKTVLVTRIDGEKELALEKQFTVAKYDETARIAVLGEIPTPNEFMMSVLQVFTDCSTERSRL